MAKLHENQIGKAQKIAGYILSILFSFQVFMAGFLKVIGDANIILRMNKIPNWGDKLMFVGVLQLVLLVMYWIPKTQKLGFYLLCAYVGGIIVAEVVAGTHVEQGMPLAPSVSIATAILLYAGTILRFPSLIRKN